MGAMTGEGGGNGVSDVLSLSSFLSPTGATVGFLATFQSDAATGTSPPPGNFPAGVTNLLENGNLQLLTPKADICSAAKQGPAGSWTRVAKTVKVGSDKPSFSKAQGDSSSAA